MSRTGAAPSPLGLAGFAVAALLLSVLVLVHQEHVYERDPQLRARAGLVDAASDISLMRAANFSRALSAIDARTPAGGAITGMSVMPANVSATVVSASGAVTDVTVTPGLHVSVNATGNRVTDRRGLRATDIPAGGPQRILAEAQRRFALQPADFERLELDRPVGDQPGAWSASWSQPTDDDGLVAALDGSHLRRPFAPEPG